VIVTSQELRHLENEAARLVEEAKAYEHVEALLASSEKREGRPRVLTVKALFVALHLLSFSGSYFLIDVPKVINELSPAMKKRVGMSGRKITARQVNYLMTRIDEVLRAEFANTEASEEQRYFDFDVVFSAIVTVGAHPDAKGSLSISVDGSDIPTWASDRNLHQRLVDPETGEVEWSKVRKTTDTDAGWRGRNNDEGKPALLGYELTAAVSVKDVDGPDVPRATVAARFRPLSRTDFRDAALAVIKEVKDKRGVLGDVLVDRGYTQSKHGNDFLNPVRALGGEPVFDLKDNQIGVWGTLRGAIIIDGQLYSPSLPKKLRNLTPPRSKGTNVYNPNPQEVADYEAAIKARSIYALLPHGKMSAKGTMVFQCPGAAGKLLCPLQAPALKAQIGAMPAANPPKKALADTVCSSRYRTFDIARELPLYQRDIYGSSEWRKSYRRRGGSVEPHFGGLKDEAAASFRRGKVRVRGIIKTGLMVAFALATTNRRLALAWDERKKSTNQHSSAARRARRARYSHRLTKIALDAKDQGKLLYPLRG
jgi:hypothetical protein